MHITIMRNRRICISNTSKEFACYSLTTHIFSLRSTHIFWYMQLLLGFHHFRYFSRFSVVGNNISKVVPKRISFPTISYFYLFVFICIIVFEIITVLDITNCIRYYKQVLHFAYSMYTRSTFSLQVHMSVLWTICCLVINVNCITELLLSLRIFLSLTDLINFFLIKYLCMYIK